MCLKHAKMLKEYLGGIELPAGGWKSDAMRNWSKEDQYTAAKAALAPAAAAPAAAAGTGSELALANAAPAAQPADAAIVGAVN